jgi:phosphoribosylglycinamide formyltransferase-1
MRNIAVFASGNGSNFQAIIDAIHVGELDATISLLVCDQPGAYVIDRAKAAGISPFVFNAKDYRSKEEYEKKISLLLQERDVELVVLAGFMRLIGPTLLTEFKGRIVNIHPSLLPLFPGKDAIGQALAQKAKWSGVTVHFVDEGMDTGPIIASERVRLDENETRETLQRKIQSIEHTLYPAILRMILTRGDDNFDKETSTY